jgi:hypothetical protein
MKTIGMCVIAGMSLVLPFAASAQSDDAKYCQALIDKFRDVESSNSGNVDIPIAMAACAKGDTATGIPIMEKALRARKVTLPPRN